MLFPLFALAVWRLPRPGVQRLPLMLLLLAVCVWGIASLHVSGLIPGTSQEAVTFLSRLQGDKDGLRTRELYSRYNQIAQTYSLPGIELVQRSFRTTEEARNWLNRRTNVPFLVSGTLEWVSIDFPHDASPYFRFAKNVVSAEQAPTFMKEWARDLHLNLETEIALVHLPGYEIPFVVAFQPEAISVPSEPTELCRHFIAWLGKGLVRPPRMLDGERRVQDLREENIAERKDAFNEAAHIEGAWKSPVPKSLALYFLGTLNFMLSLDGEQIDQASLQLAHESFRDSGHGLQRSRSLEFFTVLFNNAALAQLVDYSDPSAFEDARRMLWLAATSYKENKRITVGEKAALINLLVLQNSS